MSRRLSASHGSIDPEALSGEPAFDGGQPLGDALERDATTDPVERVSVQTADGLGVSPGWRSSWALVRVVDSLCGAYEVGDGEPGGRLTLARSLTRLAGS
jgi:hypothetical protein